MPKRVELHFLPSGIIHFSVDGRLCYPGQEPDPAGSGGLLWSLTERDSAECSVIRLGGLNAKPHDKPYQATVGGDRDVLNLRWATTTLAGNSKDGKY